MPTSGNPSCYTCTLLKSGEKCFAHRAISKPVPAKQRRYTISKRPTGFDPDWESRAVERALRRTNPDLVHLLEWDEA
jgi:hypothetical protein